MRFVLANHSSYPRVGDGAHLQRLRRAYAKRETGKITQGEYEGIASDYAAEVIAEQADAGCDLVTDGLVYWYDLISHPASRLDGVEINGLVRFFDTNTYVRQPEATGPIGGTFGLAEDFTGAKAVARQPLKAVVPGPYTLARHTVSGDGGSLSRLASAYAEALGRELEALNAAGATFVQIDEPSLLRDPEDAVLVRNVLAKAAKHKGDLTLSLATYFGDATTIYGELLHMPVDMLAFDLTYSPRLADCICSEPGDKPVALGVVDGRNTKPDDVDAVARVVERVAAALDVHGIKEIHVQPSCGLEFLPRDRAKRKLERMQEIASAVTGETT
jgi:5-methyltetrahydropteroyltriglutamate--homocysteine methyltransferase